MNELESPVMRLAENDVKRLSEIKKQLSLIPSDENSFLKMESLFYEVLAMARTYQSESNFNPFLSQFKQIFETKYKLTQEKYTKSRQRELIIKQFKIAFNDAVSTWIKKPTFQ